MNLATQLIPEKVLNLNPSLYCVGELQLADGKKEIERYIFFFIFSYVCVWDVHGTAGGPRGQERLQSSRAVVTDDCEPPDMGAGS